MPYRTIHWIKLEKRLLNDYRFYTMPEEGQLLFVKMLMLAGETSNKIPKKMSILKSALRATQSESRLQELIDIIKATFPKFKENNHFYSFLEWNKRHNQVSPKHILRITQAYPQATVDKNKNKNKIKSKKDALNSLDKIEQDLLIERKKHNGQKDV